MSPCASATVTPKHRLLVLAEPSIWPQLKAISHDGPLPLSLTSAHTKEEALGLLEQQPFGGMLLSTTYASLRLVEEVMRLQPRLRLVFLSQPGATDTLIKIAQRGYSTASVRYESGPAAAIEAIAAFLLPRSAGRHYLDRILTVDFTHESGSIVCDRPVIDMSNEGLSFLMGAHTPGGLLFPGHDISKVQVRDGGRVILHAPAAAIRHMEAVQLDDHTAPATNFRVGICFQKPAAASGKRRSVGDAPQIVALLRQAIEAGSLVLAAPHEPMRRFACSPGSRSQVRSDNLELAGCWPCDWVRGSVVQGTFEAGAWGYEFLSSILLRQISHNNTPLAHARQEKVLLAMPPVISATQKRRALRHRIASPSAVSARILSPFDGGWLKGHVTDISASGLALQLHGADALAPIGTLLAEVVICGLSAQEIRAHGEICAHRANPDNDLEPRVCGVRLHWHTEADQVAVADALISRKTPSISGSARLTFTDLWTLFKRTGLLYEQKEQLLAPILTEVDRNLSTLLAAPLPSVLKTVVYKRDEELLGHQSLLRAYDQTWIAQHMTADRAGGRGVYAARDANVGITDCIIQSPDMEWIKAYFQPQKPAPDRIIGAFARKMVGHPQSDLRLLAYMVSRCDTPTYDSSSLGTQQGISVRAMQPSDFGLLEAHFIQTGRLVELQSDDLTLAKLALSQVAEKYRQLGLDRWREMLVAERGTSVVGCALMEFSSLGLNLSDITNHVAIHVWDQHTSAVPALAIAARTRCAQLGRSHCLVLCEPPHAKHLSRFGFSKRREYASWTFHRSLALDYQQHVLQLFG